MGALRRIAAEQDRSATVELIRDLVDPGIAEAERELIADTLGSVGDPRAVAALTEIGLDRSRPVATRRAALRALEDSASCPEGADLRSWWSAGDDVVRACVLRQAGRSEADLLEPVARNPRHELHRHALRGLEFQFEEPHRQRHKIRGLDHPDPEVRKTAAEVLCWDEPLAAEPALHRAATDDVPDVACAAIDTLRYYRSRATLRLLHEIGRGADERAAAARDAEDDMRVDFERAAPRLRHWLTPVGDLLGPPEPVATPSSRQPPPGPSERPVPSAADIVAEYSDLDGPWARRLDRLRRYDWAGLPPADRPALAAFLSDHPDPEVRALCCAALSTWQDSETLRALAHDPRSGVRKAAVYYLRFVPRSREIATLTWDLVASGRVAGASGYEALATCAAHTPPGDLDDRLIALARADLRESIRAEAVSLLGDRVQPLLPMLTRPPLLTWAVHIRLLQACRKYGLRPPRAETLRSVDALDLVVALADFDS